MAYNPGWGGWFGKGMCKVTIKRIFDDGGHRQVQARPQVQEGRFKSSAPLPFHHLLIPEAIRRMVIYHPYGLHKGIADGGPHKFETLLLEGFTHPVR